MGRLRIVKGKIYEMVEEHLHYYSEADILETAGVTYVENSETDILYGGSPEKAPSADLVNYYIKVRIYNPPVVDPANPPKKYNGEFGFDWVDVDPSSGEVQKIQDVDFSNVEYFYKKGATANDLGDIIAKSADEQGAKDAIAANYRLSECPKPCKDGRIDMPFVLIKPGQEISLSLEVVVVRNTLTDEKIYLEGNDFYSFELVGGIKTGNKTEKIIADKEIIVLKIKCLKESPETTFKIKQENPTQKLETVGGFTMMENKVLKLKFRVIALVANEPSASAKAQALFQKFKDNKVKEYLNENSLNQAGYEVEIENQAMFDTLGSGDLDDYFYAFDKTDWTNKKLFTPNFAKKKKTRHIKISYTPDGKEVKTETISEVTSTMDVISYENEVDNETMKAYKEKLIGKGKSYEGGIIILCDFEADDENTGAYSRTSPLDHYMLMVYSTNIDSKDTYAHEIGHMLGLPHLFFGVKEKDAYKNAREDILGNGQLEKNADGSKNDNYKAGINKDILVAKSKDTYYIMNKFYSNKKSLTTYLNNFIAYYQEKLKTVNYTEAAKKSINKEISENERALRKLLNVSDCSYKEYELDCYFLKNDYVKFLEEKKQYLNEVLEQMELSILLYKQNTTHNIMDYYNSRLRFNHNQIKIMRDDSKNFLEEYCKCKAPVKKK